MLEIGLDSSPILRVFAKIIESQTRAGKIAGTWECSERASHPRLDRAPASLGRAKESIAVNKEFRLLAAIFSQLRHDAVYDGARDVLRQLK